MRLVFSWIAILCGYAMLPANVTAADDFAGAEQVWQCEVNATRFSLRVRSWERSEPRSAEQSQGPDESGFYTMPSSTIFREYVLFAMEEHEETPVWRRRLSAPKTFVAHGTSAMLRLRPLDLAWGGKTGLFLTAYSGTLWLEHVGKDGLQEETRLVLAGENEALGQVAVAGKVEAQDDAVFVFAEFAATPPAAWKVVGDEASFIEDQSVVDKVFGQQRIVQRPIGIAVQTRPATAELSARPRAMELEAETAYVQQVPSAATDTGATTVVWVLCIVAAGLCVAVWLSRRRSRRRSSSP